mmetsp:Transcript_19915/g.55068  ORF Transcript_19915/g.55068 Transcript_19915/m.55068 type:complete len:225 (+) Transcript_19915:142-816(+)
MSGDFRHLGKGAIHQVSSIPNRANSDGESFLSTFFSSSSADGASPLAEVGDCAGLCKLSICAAVAVTAAEASSAADSSMFSAEFVSLVCGSDGVVSFGNADSKLDDSGDVGVDTFALPPPEKPPLPPDPVRTCGLWCPPSTSRSAFGDIERECELCLGSDVAWRLGLVLWGAAQAVDGAAACVWIWCKFDAVRGPVGPPERPPLPLIRVGAAWEPCPECADGAW